LFEAASGLKVNSAKSNLIFVGNVDHLGRLAGILGCEVATLPVKYLGLPLGASYKSTHIWDGVIEKIEHRLASWKSLYLSKDGRVTLIKSILANLPLYYCLCSLFREVLLLALRSYNGIFYGVGLVKNSNITW
jgi:hypothetical protein